MAREFEFKCHECGEIHSGSPSLSYAFPTYVFGVPEEERPERVKHSSDLCRILGPNGVDGDDTIYCVRVTLNVPIHGADDPFCWGVWVTQSKESFDRYLETFSEDQSELQSFGWLAVTMPGYNTTEPGEPYEHLACDVNWGPPGKRPKIELHESEHQLFLDQRDGISWDRAIELATLAIHSG
jgi:hypothetical protein